MVWEDVAPYTKAARDLGRRFQFLEQLRERTEGQTSKRVPARDLGTRLGFDVGTSDAAAQYLVSKGLGKYSTAGVPGGLISITPEGIEALEWTVAHPKESSDHFPAFDVMFIEGTTPSADTNAWGARPLARETSPKRPPDSPLSDYWAKIKGILGR